MQITPIQTGTVDIRSRHYRSTGTNALAKRLVDTMRDKTWLDGLPITTYLIETDDGKRILVDTGETTKAGQPGYVPRWHYIAQKLARFDVAPADEIGPQLEQRGIDPKSIDTVVMTHMHTDHAGGLNHLAHAEIVMSKAEAKASLAKTGVLNGYLNMHYPRDMRVRPVEFLGSPWEHFEATVQLADNIRLLPTPGHSPGHLSVAIERDDDTVVLLAGDACYSEENLKEGILDGVAAQAKAHRATTAQLQELCRRRRVIVVPCHEHDGARRLAEDVPTTA